MSNSQSRAHLNRVSLNISEVHAKHRRRLHRPSYRVFRRSATSVATVLRGGEELYPADPLAAKGKVGRSAFTFDHADFSPAAAKEDSEMNITVATDDRSESNDESTSLVMEEEEEVDGERRSEHTAKTTCSSSSKVTAEESLGYGKSTSSAVHSNLFVEMEDENQELQKNGNKEEDEKLLSAHDPFGFPRPREKDDAPFPTHQLILKCACHRLMIVVLCVAFNYTIRIIIASHWLAMQQPTLSLFHICRPILLTNSTSGT